VRISTEAHKDSRFSPLVDQRKNKVTHSILCCPIVSESTSSSSSSDSSSRIVGVISVRDEKDRGGFEQEEEKLLKVFCAQAAVAITNSKRFSSIMEQQEVKESDHSAADYLKKNRGMNLADDDIAHFQYKMEDIQMKGAIGNGSYGEVYRALVSGSIVAVKKLHVRNLKAEQVDAFCKEASLMCQLKHTNIVGFIGAVTEPSNLCIITQYCARGSLADLLLEHKIDMNYKLKMKFAIDAAKGMIYLHHCFPETDHQILTNRGWMGLEGVEAAMAEKETAVVDGRAPFEVACYIAGSEEVVYRVPNALVKSGIETHNMVDFVTEGADVKGARNTPQQERVSLRVTGNHNLHVKYGAAQKDIVTGADTNEVDFAADAKYHCATADEVFAKSVADPETVTRMLAFANGGVGEVEAGALPFLAPLDLEHASSEQIDAFLFVYGVWCRAGAMASDAQSIIFAVKSAECSTLDRALSCLFADAAAYSKATEVDQQGRATYAITHPSWVAYWLRECVHGAATATSFASWVWRSRHLTRTQLRSVLAGMRSTDSVEDASIFTASDALRDEVSIVALLAGYSSSITAEVGMDDAAIGWRVSYTDAIGASQPSIRSGRDLSRSTYVGRVWCVEVPTADHLIVVRRVEEGRAPSKPLVLGNSNPVILHRDLKSDNLLVTQEWIVKGT
jgi:hypothetical protein